MNNSSKMPRIAAATALVVCMVTAFATLGGVGQAGNVISAVQSQYGKKVTICHKGKTIKVSKQAMRGHMRHHDTLGPCSTVKAKKHKKHHKHVAKPKHEHSAKVKHEEHATKAKTDSEKSKGDKPGNGNGRGR